MKNLEEVKRIVGQRAAQFVEEGMNVGLGTGSTAYWFIESLIERQKKGLNIHVAASSQKSLDHAKKGGLPLIEMEDLSYLDITVDGADEIDFEKRMIKGGGGALLREKILASMSKEFIVVVDETKLSLKLGSKKLPIEIIPFGFKATISHLNRLGFKGSFRLVSENKMYITDNGNYIYDVYLDGHHLDPAQDHAKLVSVPGVVETGFFLDFKGRVVVGFLDGSLKVM